MIHVRRPPHRLGLVLGALILAIGCKEAPEPPKKKVDKPAAKPAAKSKPKPAVVIDGMRVEVGKLPAGQCRRTLCISGPGELDSEPNGDLAELCRRSPGLVMGCPSDGGGKRCQTLWPVDRWQQGLDALVSTLDRNADGNVDGKDGACPVSLAGWSTGAAVIANALPKALAERVDAKHAQIHNLVAIAPFSLDRDPQQPFDIAANVNKAFIYRYSVSHEHDCSRAFEGGPWLSPAPVCAEGTTCYDYDYSRDTGDLAYISRRGSRAAAEISHCNIVSVVARIGLDNLSRGQEAYMELVPPYADGTHGGRVHVQKFQPSPP
jgi:hypothetical protein